jgi:hypothetical protein
MIEVSLSKKNYDACVQGDRSFLITDNTELSIQKGDTIRHFETDEKELDTGFWFDAEVKFVTNYEQKDNFIVYQFKVINAGAKPGKGTIGIQKRTRHG